MFTQLSSAGASTPDRATCSRFARAVAETVFSLAIQADFQAERDDSKLELLIKLAEIVSQHKCLAGLERGFLVLKSGIQNAPACHRLP